MPLSLVLQPDLLKTMREYVGKAKDDQGNAIKELGQLSRDEFLEFYRQYTGMKTDPSSNGKSLKK